MEDGVKSGLSIAVSVHKDRFKIIAFNGSFTLHSYELEEPELLQEFTLTAPKNIIIDLKECKFITSFAVGKFVYFAKLARLQGSRLAFINLSSQARSVFEMTNLLGQLNVHDSLADAEKFLEEQNGAATT